MVKIMGRKADIMIVPLPSGEAKCEIRYEDGKVLVAKARKKESPSYGFVTEVSFEEALGMKEMAEILNALRLEKEWVDEAFTTNEEQIVTSFEREEYSLYQLQHKEQFDREYPRFREYLEELPKIMKSKATVSTYKSRFKDFCWHLYKHSVILEDLDMSVIEEFVDEKRKTFGEVSASSYLTVIRHYAKLYDCTSKLKGIKAYERGKEAPEAENHSKIMHILSMLREKVKKTDEEGTREEKAEARMKYLLFELSKTYGLTNKELLSLTWTIDFAREIFYVHAKNSKKRALPFDSIIKKAFTELMEVSNYTEPHHYIFSLQGGAVMSDAALKNMFQEFGTTVSKMRNSVIERVAKSVQTGYLERREAVYALNVSEEQFNLFLGEIDESPEGIRHVFF